MTLDPVATAAPPASPVPSLVGRDILVLSPTPTWPLDVGNRKRVHAVCSELRRRGARIHFLYYPFEWWYTAVPQPHWDAMASQWDSFHVTPVTRPLQAAPAGDHHHIDEWWDPAIEPMLRWLLLRGRYDAFIVNYGFLSRALEFAQPGTLRILDTHDRFSGRKEILARMGIAPEYFFTTEPEEAKGLARADLVWAIKEEEAEFFRRITDKPVITMPHFEPSIPLAARETRDTDDLVFGMVGARNSLNLRNATRFIEEALPILRRRLAPVRIRFGGGMCEDLERLDPLPSGVDLAGRFDDPADFYGTVDAVIVPMTHSTGLKIKAVEAFSLGLPVIAHRHAVEGIPVTHAFHRCDSMESVAASCLALAADRSLLAPLREATLRTQERLAVEATDAMDATARRIAAPLTIVLAVAPEFVADDSAYGQHVRETIEYLKHLCPIVLYADLPLPGSFTAWCHRFLHQAGTLKIVLSPSAAEAMGFRHDRRRSPPFPLFHSVERLGDVLQRLPHRLLWLADLPRELVSGDLPPTLTTNAYVRVDACRLLDRWNDDEIVAALSRLPGGVPIALSAPTADPAVPPEMARRGQRVPFWREVRGGLWAPWAPDATREPEVWITVAPDQPGVSSAWAQAVRELSPSPTTVRLLLPTRSALRAAAPWLGEQRENRGDTVQNAVHNLVFRTRRPTLVLDVAGREADFAVLHETASRLGVPWLGAWRRAGGGAIQGLLETPTVPLTVESLISRIADVLHTPPARPEGFNAPAFANDAGWQWVWKSVSFRKSLVL